MNNVSYELVQPFMNSVPSMKGMIQMGGNPACELLKLPIFQDLIKNPPKDPPYDLIIVEVSTKYSFQHQIYFFHLNQIY